MLKLMFLLLLVYFGHANDTFKLNNILPSNQLPSQIPQGVTKRNSDSNLESNLVNEERSIEPCQKQNTRSFDTNKGSDMPQTLPTLIPAKERAFNIADENEDRSNFVILEDEKFSSLENYRSPKANKIDHIIIKTNNDNIPRSRRILPGILKNPTKEELEYHKLFQNKPQTNDNTQFPYNTRRSYVPNLDKATNNVNIEDDMNLIEERNHPIMEDQLIDPTKGEGIFDMKERSVSLLENNRICYACSSVSDPTCWAPDNRTTSKYCQKGHNSCLTKRFNYKGTSFVVRDCGSYCVNQNGNRYSSCSICHSDLCNSASTIGLFNVTIVFATLFGILFNKR